AGPFIWKGEKVMYSILRDVTESIKLEQEVIESRELLKNMADSMPAFVGVADAKTIKYKFVNQKFVEAFNKDRDEIIGAYFGDILGEKNARFAMDYINEARRGKSSSYINTFDISNGKRYVNVNFTPSFGPDGEVKDIIILSHDITEQKQAENELKEAKVLLEKQNAELKGLNTTKDKFFSIIAHDLRSPFSALLGMGEVLKENAKDKDWSDAEEIINVMHESATNVYELLENLLQWSIIQTDQIKFRPERVCLKNIIDSVLNLTESKAVEKNIHIRTFVDENICMNGDANMMSTVIRNLISNAIKFTPENGKIEVDCRKDDKNIKISVSDTGVGIREDMMDKLFNVDEKHSTVGTQNEKGTGLGLILCNEFVNIHKGSIKVESELNKGSKFIVTIPLT
ncbi:PAS domain-containing sensor histidine kinase, partial [bacterium]|nr:PAS domain-containing sensor histidine kinase [bacterium]